MSHGERFKPDDFVARFGASVEPDAAPGRPYAGWSAIVGEGESVCEPVSLVQPPTDAATGGAVAAVGVMDFNLDSTPHNLHTERPVTAARSDVWFDGEGEWFGKVSWMGERAELLLVDDADCTLRLGGAKGREPVRVTAELVESPVAIEECLGEWGQGGVSEEERRAISVQRARRNCTWKILSINADRMLTLTQRDRIPTRERAVQLAGEFVRKVKRGLYRHFVCVYVIEPHKTDGFHIHMAISRFYDLNILRLYWHRTITGRPLKRILRLEESPGNVQLGKVLKSDKLVRYMTKYITKNFAEAIPPGARRYFASEKIGGPNVRKFRMARSLGAEVYRARCLLERGGFRYVRHFETFIAGRRAIWILGELRRGCSAGFGDAPNAA